MSVNSLNHPTFDNTIDVVSFSAKSPFDYNVKKENVHYTQKGIFYASQAKEEDSYDDSSDDDFINVNFLMILGLFSLFFAFSPSKLLESEIPHSDEVQPPTSQTQGFVPGKIVFSTKQKIIIFIAIIISVVLIIIGICIACNLGKKTRKNPDLSEIEKFMLPPSSSPFSNM